MPSITETTTVFVEGDALYEAMHADLAGATRDARLECYIVADDDVGGPMLTALADLAQAGRRVQVRIDAVGSWRLIPPERVLP